MSIRTKAFNIIILFSFLLFLVLVACDDTVTDVDKEIVFPSKNVSFQEHVYPVFQNRCAISDCHNNSYRAGSYSLETYDEATRPGIIDPYSPETSVLLWRIKGIGLPIMPPPDAAYPLKKNHIDGIEQWIKEGAQNN